MKAMLKDLILRVANMLHNRIHDFRHQPETLPGRWVLRSRHPQVQWKPWHGHGLRSGSCGCVLNMRSTSNPAKKEINKERKREREREKERRKESEEEREREGKTAKKRERERTRRRGRQARERGKKEKDKKKETYLE